jgi:hypothetical protein
MTKTLIEALEALHRKHTLSSNEIWDDDVSIPWIDIRAIIEQYKTEGAEPDAWTWERATEISELPGKERYSGFERVHSRNKPNIPEGDKSRRNLRPLYFHPSPAIVGELVKALEKLTAVCRRQFDTKRVKDGVVLHEAEALLARAKAMTE